MKYNELQDLYTDILILRDGKESITPGQLESVLDRSLHVTAQAMRLGQAGQDFKEAVAEGNDKKIKEAQAFLISGVNATERMRPKRTPTRASEPVIVKAHNSGSNMRGRNIYAARA